MPVVAGHSVRRWNERIASVTRAINKIGPLRRIVDSDGQMKVMEGNDL
jgi:hypothetical protein